MADGAFHPDIAAHRVEILPADPETQARPADRGDERALEPHELLEQLALILRRDTFTLVGDANHHPTLRRIGVHRVRSSLGRQRLSRR